MKIAYGNPIHYCIFIALICAITFCSYKIGIAVFGVKETNITIHPPILAEVIQEKLKKTIQNLAFYNAHFLKTELNSLYPDIQNVVSAFYANNLAEIDITIADPIACINDTYILTESATLVNKSYFNDRYIHLPEIIVSDLSLLTLSGKKWLLTYLPLLKKDFSISWCTENEIHLRNKKNKYLDIICCSSVNFNTDLFNRIQAIEKKVNEKNETMIRKKEWIADIRFEKQIILGGKKGGKEYG
jgi:hypothetical protein